MGPFFFGAQQYKECSLAETSKKARTILNRGRFGTIVEVLRALVATFSVYRATTQKH